MIRSFQFIGIGIAILSVASLAGCGGSEEGEKVHPVSGSVTLDGKPVAKGELVFEDPEGKSAGGSAAIKDGKYSTDCTAGKFKVRISARKETGPKDATGVAPSEETIPAKYNESTELEVEIKAGENKHDFKLTS